MGRSGEIGGNIVELEVGEERILLNFGQSFSAGKEFFMDFLQPRKSAGLLDYLEFGLVPPLQGLYHPDLLSLTEFSPEPPRYSGVFLSHAHGIISCTLISSTRASLSIWKRPPTPSFRPPKKQVKRSAWEITRKSWSSEPETQ